MHLDEDNNSHLLADLSIAYPFLILGICLYLRFLPWDAPDEAFLEFSLNGVILSGSPETVTSGSTPRAAMCLLELGVPVLGICYGMQTLATQLGGRVESVDKHEFGHAEIDVDPGSQLLAGLSSEVGPLPVWMSHRVRLSSSKAVNLRPTVGWAHLAQWKPVPKTATSRM